MLDGAQSGFIRLEALLPAEFDARIYRELHADLRQMTDEQLGSHYQRHGMRERRRCHALADRKAFVGLIQQDVDALEIGSFANPLLRGPRVRYFDVLDKAGLTLRAQSVGYSSNRIPDVQFVSSEGDLSIVGARSFDVVLSSHVIEHQPDLLGHLDVVERVLKPIGARPHRRHSPLPESRGGKRVLGGFEGSAS